MAATLGMQGVLTQRPCGSFKRVRRVNCYHVTGRILNFSSVSDAIIIPVGGKVINEQVGQPGERQGPRTLGV